MPAFRQVVCLVLVLVLGSVYANGMQAIEFPQNGECVPDTVYIPTEVVHPYVLGSTTINITVYTQPDRKQMGPPCPRTPLNDPIPGYSFINLHENENTSVVAAKTLIYQKGGGTIVFLEHGGTRDITFLYNGVSYTIDPNRMFTWAGLEANLIPFNRDAAMLVTAFAQTLLDIYQFDSLPIILALHNNSPSYSALDYLPRGPYAEDAEKVYIGRNFNPRDFYFISNGPEGNNLYDCLTAQGFNAVLQVPYFTPNSTLTDDGSLSVYSAINQKPYVNTEAAAECCSQGTAIVNQLILLDHLTTQVSNLE